MKILLTGADQSLGAALYPGLAANNQVSGIGDAPDGGDFPGSYRNIDLRAPEAAQRAVEGMDLVVHTQPYSAQLGTGEDAEGALIDQVARSTYVLVRAANEAGIGRIVLLTRLDIMQDYPAAYQVKPDWAPRPRPEAAFLAPYMAELVCCEIARTGKMETICLRLGQADTATVTEAVATAVARDTNTSEYSWTLEHIGQRS
jgi:nucleoside-diphosphate-sugar epimerase